MPLVNPHHPDRFLLLPNKPLWLEFMYEWEYARFDNDSLFDRRGRNRRDHTSLFGLTLSQVLLRNRQRDLVLHVIARYMDADSNVRFADGSNPFTFDKFVLSQSLRHSC